MIAINPVLGEEKSELKVMTWNVHCSRGADSTRQRNIAELIIEENVDFVQLNEYNQDSCSITDSLLRIKYPFSEEYQSHQICGDIFYSKIPLAKSGYLTWRVPNSIYSKIYAFIFRCKIAYY